ncbi:hypothetical protein ACHHV8_22735 [Paenibacillus sp. TAB 01]|uniref:hypothetical protein n=1 Tax=Paenibacillus sp. TAB 01 TaxID=3368988 RepID=UPI0037537724
MDEEAAARAALRNRLIEAEAALQEAEEEYEMFCRQLSTYKKAIDDQKAVILDIKSKMGLWVQ